MNVSFYEQYGTARLHVVTSNRNHWTDVVSIAGVLSQINDSRHSNEQLFADDRGRGTRDEGCLMMRLLSTVMG